MSFSFGFSGDDIEHESGDASSVNVHGTVTADYNPPPVPAQRHDLNEVLASLPDKISFSVLSVTSPKGHTTRLPRRELFDVRLQLMAEDDGMSSDSLAGLDKADVRTNVYEGGYKTWECSIDLVRYLLDRGPRRDLDDLVRVNHVIEMGCGTAVPSLLLFEYALRNSLSLYFTLTDYNVDVLRLVTVPNLILLWASTLDEMRSQTIFGEDGNPLGSVEDHGDLQLSSSVCNAFIQDLHSQGLVLTLISGSWVPSTTLLELIPSDPALNTLLLASETIYSPSSLTAFTEAMAELLKRIKSGKALVAAKRFYFGVGGSVDGFREECAKRGCVASEIDFEGLDEGVRRSLVEVQMY